MSSLDDLVPRKAEALDDELVEAVERHDYERHTRALSLLHDLRIAREKGWSKCSTCRRRHQIWQMFRCYYCGFFVCEDCAEEHFGESRSHYFNNDGYCK